MKTAHRKARDNNDKAIDDPLAMTDRHRHRAIGDSHQILSDHIPTLASAQDFWRAATKLMTFHSPQCCMIREVVCARRNVLRKNLGRCIRLARIEVLFPDDWQRRQRGLYCQPPGVIAGHKAPKSPWPVTPHGRSRGAFNTDFVLGPFWIANEPRTSVGGSHQSLIPQ